MNVLDVELGTELIYCHRNPTGGRYHASVARKHLVFGVKYTLEKREIGELETKIWVKEVKGVAFYIGHFAVCESLVHEYSPNSNSPALQRLTGITGNIEGQSQSRNFFETQNFEGCSDDDIGSLKNGIPHHFCTFQDIVLEALSYNYEIMIVNDDDKVPLTLYYSKNGHFNLTA